MRILVITIFLSTNLLNAHEKAVREQDINNNNLQTETLNEQDSSKNQSSIIASRLLKSSATYAAKALVKQDIKGMLIPPSLDVSVKIDPSKYPAIPRAVAEGLTTEIATGEVFHQLKKLAVENNCDYPDSWKKYKLVTINSDAGAGITITIVDTCDIVARFILSYIIGSYVVQPTSNALFDKKAA